MNTKDIKTPEQLVAFWEHDATLQDVMDAMGPDSLTGALQVGAIVINYDLASQAGIFISAISIMLATMTMMGQSEFEERHNVTLTVEDRLRVLVAEIRLLYPKVLSDMMQAQAAIPEREEDGKVH